MTLGATQRSRILEVLLAARGGWVPLPNILELKISQFGARILELRRSGLNIENRTETIDGQRHSWYRLPVGSGKKSLASTVTRGEAIPTNTPHSLFGELGQGSYRDPEEGWR